MKVLITGIAGFTGSWLAEHYLAEGEAEIHGTVRQRSDLRNLSDCEGDLHLHHCDIRDVHGLSRLIEEGDFDIIHHLAAISYVTYSFTNPAETMDTNIKGTLNVLEASRKSKSDPIIHIVGSSEEYGYVREEELPIKETNPLSPRSPYGVSKCATDMLGQQYWASYGLKTVVTRAFNHEGPRRPGFFVTSKIARQVLEIKMGFRKKMSFGLLTPKRDCTHVFDMVRAYMLAVKSSGIQYGTPYNICTGESYSIGQMIDIAREVVDLDEVEITQDADQIRPSDVPVLLGDCAKFKEATGWKHNFTMTDIMWDTITWWNEQNSKYNLFKPEERS